MNNIKRREALKRTSYIMGGTLAAPTILGLLNGCSAQPGLKWDPVFFTEDQARLVTRLADIILPKTDSPGATELGVPKFIEDIVSRVMEDKDREAFMSGLNEFEQESERQAGRKFNDLDEDEQLSFVTSQHVLIEGKKDLEEEDRPFIWKIKELIIAGYCTTEGGMTKILQYVAIPTEYKACISLEEAGGKTWAT